MTKLMTMAKWKQMETGINKLKINESKIVICFSNKNNLIYGGALTTDLSCACFLLNTRISRRYAPKILGSLANFIRPLVPPSPVCVYNCI